MGAPDLFMAMGRTDQVPYNMLSCSSKREYAYTQTLLLLYASLCIAILYYRSHTCRIFCTSISESQGYTLCTELVLLTLTRNH